MKITRETRFRINAVTPFLKSLSNTSYFPIQQKAISGDADFIVCCNGKFVWLELKADDGEASELQQYKALWVAKTNGAVFIARPENWTCVKQLIKEIENGKTIKDELNESGIYGRFK